MEQQNKLVIILNKLSDEVIDLLDKKEPLNENFDKLTHFINTYNTIIISQQECFNKQAQFLEILKQQQQQNKK